MLLADQQGSQGFSVLNLVILVAIVAVLWPLLRSIRAAAARRRARLYASEREEQGLTEENDPDLRHDRP